MNDNSKFKLGLFIILAAAVFFAGLLILGSLDRFKEKAYITTFVSESVQGLSVGSSVKYQGVPIGAVREIAIYPRGNVIRIDMEVNISKFKIQEEDGDTVSITVDEFNKGIARAVEKGLRCRLELEGITGGKYVELQFDKDSTPPELSADQFALDAPYIPSLPSLISDLRGSVTSILAKLDSIDYKGLSDKANATLEAINERSIPKLDATLDSVNSMITSIEKDLIPSAHQSIDNLEKLTGSDVRQRIETLIENAKLASESVQSLVKTVEEEIKVIEFGQISENLRAFLTNAIRTSSTLDDAIFNINNGVDALIELIQYIDSDPSALIQGKKKQKSADDGKDR